MDPKTHRKCHCCQGVGWIALSPIHTALQEIDYRLSACSTLKDKIMVTCNTAVSISFIKSLLSRHDPKLNLDRVEYTVLNLKEEGWLLHNGETGKYIVNEAQVSSFF